MNNERKATPTFDEMAKRRWDDGLANHERLRQILPFLKEEEGYF